MAFAEVLQLHLSVWLQASICQTIIFIVSAKVTPILHFFTHQVFFCPLFSPLHLNIPINIY